MATIEERTSNDELLEFVRLQQKLAEALEEVGGGESTDMGMRVERGTVSIDDTDWAFNWHGSGVLFVRAGDRVQVDMHRRLDNPMFVDRWRLEIYFQSLGRRGNKLLNRLSGSNEGSAADRVQAWLDRLAEQGRLRSLDAGFELVLR